MLKAIVSRYLVQFSPNYRLNRVAFSVVIFSHELTPDKVGDGLLVTNNLRPIRRQRKLFQVKTCDLLYKQSAVSSLKKEARYVFHKNIVSGDFAMNGFNSPLNCIIASGMTFRAQNSQKFLLRQIQ